MKLAVPTEVASGERRVAIVPESVKKLTKAGVQVVVQTGAGLAANFPDEEFSQAGATLESDPRNLYGNADFMFKVQPPMMHPSAGAHEATLLRNGAMLLTTLKPSINLDAVRKLAENKVTTFSTDQIPRITRAQSMDTLSSQANLAGYKSVLIGANELTKFFPMLMTAAGTIVAAKVFIIGAGVAGLQAIATARRLGATVEATDTRAVVKEQIESLGAKYVGVQGAEDAQDARGYAKEVSKETQEKQAQLTSDKCAASDVVITTALIGGVKAPKLITEEMVKRMKPGSVIVDLAAEAGGNCVLTEPGKNVVKYGVTICGPANIPAMMPLHASVLYSRNLTTFFTTFWKDGAFNLDVNDEIIKGCMVTHAGQVTHEPTKKAMQT